MDVHSWLNERAPRQAQRDAWCPTCGRGPAHEHCAAQDDAPPKPSACPQCGHKKVARLFYGLPMPGAIADDEVCGGCCWAPETWYCRACECAW